jgi:pimeloyl-ACP methyl ester carboxylesterase
VNEQIIYLHGFASGPSSKKAQHFRQRFREAGIEIQVPDLAEGDFEHLSISGQLRVIERLAARGPVVLIGSSMGGYLASLYAARHPEVLRVVLLAPAFGFARRWTETLDPSQLEEWKRTGWLSLYHFAEQRQSRVHYGLIADGLQYEDYPDVRQPALVYHGRNDLVVPHDYSIEFAKLRPNVRLELLESDHELADVLDAMWAGVWGFLLGEAK